MDSITIVWLMFFGICLGAVYAFFIKHFLGGLVRRLISEKAVSEASAKSLSELGYKGISAIFMRKSLSEGCGLRKYVLTVYPESTGNSDSLIRTKSAEQRYYLPYGNCSLAEKRYCDSGTTFGVLILTIVLFFIVAAVSTVAVPLIVNIMKADFKSDIRRDSEITSDTGNFAAASEADQNDRSDIAFKEDFSMLGPK